MWGQDVISIGVPRLFSVPACQFGGGEGTKIFSTKTHNINKMKKKKKKKESEQTLAMV